MWAGLATGYYTPRRAVGIRVSELVGPQAAGGLFGQLIKQTFLDIFDSSLNPFAHMSCCMSKFESCQGPL